MAYEKKRNSSILYKDDYVMVWIDSTHQRRNYSQFKVNALGTQWESLEGGSANKIEWRGDWRAAAKVVEDGFNVEMAIPFSLLKYNRNQDTFGICLMRSFPIENISVTWPDMDGRFDSVRFADWNDVNPPWERPKPVFMGYLTSSGGAGSNQSQIGVDIKHPFSVDTLGLLSINPDFGTIDQGVETVDFSYTERGLADNRPFFQDWSMALPGCIFYSRRVPDFDLGARMAGRRGPHSFGLMNARGPGALNDTALSYVRAFGDLSYVTAALTDHRTPGHRNTVGAFIGHLGWANGVRKHDLGCAVLASGTTGLQSGQLRDMGYSTSGGSGRLGGNIYYGRVDATYNPELGILSDTDTRGGSISLDWFKDYRNSKLMSLKLHSNVSRFKRLDGSPFTDGLSFGLHTAFVGAYGFSFHSTLATREEFDDAYNRLEAFWHEISPNTPGSMGYSWGRKANGRYSSMTLKQQFRFAEDLVLSVLVERERIGKPSPYAGIRRQVVTTMNYDLTPEKSVGGRIVRRLGKQNIYLSYRQQVRRGMDVYIIYGDPNAEESIGRLSLKLVRPLF